MKRDLIKISPKTTQKLKDMGVGLVYLFGSRAEGTAHPLSDFDIGIVFSDKKSFKKSKSDRSIWVQNSTIFSKKSCPRHLKIRRKCHFYRLALDNICDSHALDK